ncbi:MAG: dihydropteroate synthase [Bacteroidales bacterium]|nr:dihydropteroate synthase [Candidatus Liminaster caballi]
MAFTLILKDGREAIFHGPQVMGIVNVTPDSFYALSRVSDDDALTTRVNDMIEAGAAMIDVGAYSTRPDAAEVSAEEELDRLRRALPVIREAVGNRDVLISVDTFRADVAEVCVAQLGADIINDVSGGMLDGVMLETVARTKAPYVMMHMRGTPQTMQSLTDYPDGVYADVKQFFERQLSALSDVWVAVNGEAMPGGKVMLDPGFGFAKTLAQNYELMGGMHRLKEDFCGCPLFVGISRKSMIYRLLDTDADHALNGTTVLNTYSVMNGADILRVHDVREAVETVRIIGQMM